MVLHISEKLLFLCQRKNKQQNRAEITFPLPLDKFWFSFHDGSHRDLRIRAHSLVSYHQQVPGNRERTLDLNGWPYSQSNLPIPPALGRKGYFCTYCYLVLFLVLTSVLFGVGYQEPLRTLHLPSRLCV